MREYIVRTTSVAGDVVETTMLLDEETAEKYGAVPVKQAEVPANKARTAPNKKA